MAANPITPKWVNEEWCDDGCENNGETYLKLTNVDGGGGTQDLGWLDFVSDGNNSYFKWNNKYDTQNPTRSFFLSPKQGDRSNCKSSGKKCGCDGNDENCKPLMFMWDETQPYSSRDKQNYTQSLSAVINNSPPTCSNYSNLSSDCAIGHRQHVAGNWNPQKWGVSGDSLTGNYWRRDPVGGGFCNAIANIHDAFFLGQTKTWRSYVFSGDADQRDRIPVPANIKGSWNSNKFHNGCCKNKCPTTADLDSDCSCLNINDTQRNQMNWISDNTAAACCSLIGGDADNHQQCGWDTNNRGAFNLNNPHNKCLGFMTQYCSHHWNTCAYDPFSETSGCVTPTGKVCDAYLKNSGVQSVTTAQATISNYINSSNRAPYYDYVSWDLYYAENPTSVAYYDSHSCSSQPSEEHCISNRNDPCCRHDSKDIFFYSSLPYLCNTSNTGQCNTSPGNATGVCDDILHYFCQQFTREELQADKTLTKLCGCSLLGTNQEQPYDKPRTVIGGADWQTLQGSPQETSPYYSGTSGDQCDPLCLNCEILQCAGRCTAQTCVMDNITLNFVGNPDGSCAGDITLQQECQGCGESGCSCYFGDVTVNDVEGCVGSTTFDQVCDTCYTFTGGDLSNSVQLDCQTGNLLHPDEPDQPDQARDGKDGKPWYKHWITIATLIIVGVLVILGYGISYYYRHKKVVQPEIEIYDPTDAYYNFDFSDFDFSGY